MTALYDPMTGLTPTQRSEADAHHRRLVRLRQRTPASQPAAALSEAIDDSKPQLEAKVEPVFALEGWVQRQKELHASPEYKPLWFSIEGEIGEPPYRPRIELIQKVVAEHYKVRRTDILSSRRTANVVRPRQVAAYLAKELTLKSLPEIGRRFGGRDHTTILHALRKMNRLVEADPALREEIEALKSQLQEQP